jgi:hypothetical protein
MIIQRRSLAMFELVRKWPLFGLLIMVFATPLLANEPPGKPLSNSDASNLLRSLVFFEHNEGQADSRVLYLTQGLGYTAYFTRDGATLVFSSPSKSTQDPRAVHEKVVRLKIVGIDPHVDVIGTDQRPGVSNYFSGPDPKRWHTGVLQFSKVLYRNAYPGIDLLFEIRDGHLEYDFLIAPHANADLIRVKVEGAMPRRAANGDLAIRSAGVEVFKFRKPDAYQAGREDQPTGVRYALRGREMAFALNRYDHTRPLVIDPALIFATYMESFCSSCFNSVNDMAVDSTGIYLTGSANTVSFPAPGGGTPVPGGANRVFVVKLDPQGSTALYMSFLGYGTAQSVAVDASRSTYVSGLTFFPTPSGAQSFPTTPGAFSSAPANACGGSSRGCSVPFAAKISPDGATLQYSTLLQLFASGGQAQIMEPIKAAVDSNGVFYITGFTRAPIGFETAAGPFPATVGAFQTTPPMFPSAFVMKLNPTGSGTSYATFLGGSVDEGGPGSPGFQIAGLAVDSSGSAYVGGTIGSGWPTTPGAFHTTNGGFIDGFVTKLSPDGSSLNYSTYFSGGTAGAEILGMAVDGAGQAAVAGWGFNPPGLSAPCSLNGTAMAVAKFNATGSGLIYSKAICNNLGKFTAIALDGSGAAYVTGSVTDPSSFPIVNPIQAYFLPQSEPPVVAKLDTSGSIVWSTYLGTDPGSSLAVDPADNLYILNGLEPTTSNALEPQSPTGVAPFLAKIAPSLGAPVAVVSPLAASFANELVGMSSSATDISVANFGDANLSATISVTGDFSQTNNCASPVPGGQKCDVNVVFTPTAVGNRTGTLTVSSGGGSQAISLAGTGTAPSASFTPTVLSFEPQILGTTSVAQQVLVNNGGTGPLSITSLQITGDFAQSNACGAPVAAGSSCTVQVTFSPTAQGSRTGVLTIVDSAPGSPHTLSVSGQGTTQQASVNPPSVTFVSQLVGVTSSGAAVTLHNAGTTALTVSSISTTGDFAQSNNCGSSLAGGSDCQVTVTFTPSAAGSRTGSLAITDSSSGSPQMVPLSGVGTDFSIGIAGSGSTSATTTAGQPATYNLQMSPAGGFSGTISLTCTGAPAQSTCTPSPATLNVSASSPTPFTVTVATTAASATPPFVLREFLRPTPSWPGFASAWLLLLAILLGSITMAGRSRQMRAWSICVVLFLSAISFLAACGGGGGNTTMPQGGTPAGTYTLVISGKVGSVSHSVNLTLKVN